MMACRAFNFTFLILVAQHIDCLELDDSVRHKPAKVSFTVADGLLNLHVRYNDQAVVCRHLYDDLNYVTETRAKNGSLILLRGSQGILLQSSSNGIECRIELRNQAGNAYKVQDVPTLPKTFSAYIVFADGRTLQIEKKDGRFVAVVPTHETNQRRRLQSYFIFECKYPTLKYLKIGVIIDAAYKNRAGGTDKAIAKVRTLFKYVSVPYERQLNIHLVPFQILAHDDPECTECPFSTCSGRSAKGDYDSLIHFALVGKRNAAWHLLSGCRFPGFKGYASYMSMGKTQSAVSTSSVTNQANVVPLTAHELGHNFCGKHTFQMGGRQGAGDGIMDYSQGVWKGSEGGGLVQFHKMHEENMCKTINSLNDKEARGFVDWDERWTTAPTYKIEPTTTTSPTPTTPTKPANPTAPTTTDSSNNPSFIFWMVGVGVMLCLILTVSIVCKFRKRSRAYKPRTPRRPQAKKMPRNQEIARE